MSAVGEAFGPAGRLLDCFKAHHAGDLLAQSRPAAGHAVPVGPGTSRRMVMTREARCELGGREAASAVAIVLREGSGSADSLAAVREVAPFEPIGAFESRGPAPTGRVGESDAVLTLGRPLKSCRGRAPFGLALELWAPAWEDGAYDRLADELRAPDWVEGCMLAVSGDTARLRPSKACLKAGFDEAQLGWVLVDLARSALPQATCVQVLLVVDDGKAVDGLVEAAQSATAAGRDLRRERYRRAGVDVDCPSGLLHCGACKDKDTCASVRRIQRRRRDLREERQSCTI